MECVLLGSGGMMPTPHRALTSLVVRHGGRHYMFDAGEGAQIGLRRGRLGIKALCVIAVSHMHGDHCLGIPGVLMFRAQVPDAGMLTIIGPPGIRDFIVHLGRCMGFVPPFPMEFVEWDSDAGDVAYQDDRVRVLWGPVDHTVFCLGYRLEERSRPGSFDPRAAHVLDVPRGPRWGELQRGKVVLSRKGVPVSPHEVMGRARRGRRVCYVTDTKATKPVQRLCARTDMAFLDGMFESERATEAHARGHMTVTEAARVAKVAGTKRAVLIHLSPRYAEEDLDSLQAQATAIYSRIEIGRDMNRYHIPAPTE